MSDVVEHDPPRARRELDLSGLNPAQYEAVTLFTDRARAASTRFALTPENGPQVALLCRRLAGILVAFAGLAYVASQAEPAGTAMVMAAQNCAPTRSIKMLWVKEFPAAVELRW